MPPVPARERMNAAGAVVDGTVWHVLYFLAGAFLLPMGMRPWSIRRSGWLTWFFLATILFYAAFRTPGDVRFLLCGAGTLSTLAALAKLYERFDPSGDRPSSRR